MPYYAVANGRNIGVYDNWDDCQDQVHGYSYNDYKKFDTPDQAWDYVDERSSNGKNNVFDTNSKAVALRNNNQVALRGYDGKASSYQRTDCTKGRNTIVVRERSYTSGRSGDGYFVEKCTRTYWKNK